MTIQIYTNFKDSWVYLLIWDLQSLGCQDSCNMLEILSDFPDCNFNKKNSC